MVCNEVVDVTQFDHRYCSIQGRIESKTENENNFNLICKLYEKFNILTRLTFHMEYSEPMAPMNNNIVYSHPSKLRPLAVYF